MCPPRFSDLATALHCDKESEKAYIFFKTRCVGTCDLIWYVKEKKFVVMVIRITKVLGYKLSLY